MRLTSPALCLSLLLFSLTADAQWLSGKVKEESGIAASKVSVEFLNKENKITTNEDGSFKIFAPNLPDTLIFSSPGHEPYRVVVTEKNIKDPNFEVVLLSKRSRSREIASSPISDFGYDRSTASSAELSEVVVTGAGRVKGKKYSPKALKARGTGTYSSAVKTGETIERNYFRAADFKITAARAGSLTAGEINDYKKWKLWEDLTEKEFSGFSKLWGIAPKQRYSVQLSDKDRNAVKGERLYLIHKISGDTAWTAVSDNTGKAELWAGMADGNGKTGGYKIVSESGGKDEQVSTFHQGINHMIVDKPCTENSKVDIAFVVDATGSMDDEIEFLKLELEDVLQKTADRYTDLELRYASVFYRDNGDEYVTKKIEFQSDMLKVLNFIKLQRSGGGGDFPEALDSAMDEALNGLAWSKDARAKIMFIVLDAPPHDYAKENIFRLMKKAAAMGVRIIPIACSGTDKSNEFLLRSLALATNGSYAFLTNDSKIGNSHIAPSTDSYKVEMLNALMQRLLEQYLYSADCNYTDLSKIPVEVGVEVLKLKVYPNPSTGKFRIESNQNIKEMYIADFTGKIIMKLADPGKSNNWQVNLTSFPSGIYLIRYLTKANKQGTERVVIAR